MVNALTDRGREPCYASPDSLLSFGELSVVLGAS